MAAIAECWNGATDGAARREEPARHGVQDPAAVAITGGRIGAGVVIEGGTTLVWGLSPQQFYDTLYPIGDVRWLAVGHAPVIPSGITASWVQLAGGFVVTPPARGAGRHHPGRRLGHHDTAPAASTRGTAPPPPRR
jgi:hypothetical protein